MENKNIDYKIRNLEEQDVETVAQFEVEIAEISFGEKAVSNPDFHKKRIAKAKDRAGMFVLEAEGSILGWMWMDKKTNSITGEHYINFRSFYIAESIRGGQAADALLEKGIHYAKVSGAKQIVGKVHSQNLPMRFLYKKHGFTPTHITMEMELSYE